MKQYFTNYFFILFLCFFSEITLAIPKIGSQAPNLSATLFTGKTFEINKMKGENLLLNFYSSYSKHCAYEIGSIETFLERHGSKIKIISEEKAKKLKPDYFIVLPWHFKNFIIEKEKKFIDRGGKFIFPLPDIEIV